MGETKQQREARHKAILELLNAPGGRERSDADIARQIGCSPRSVAYVRQQNPTPEELDRTMQKLDSIFLASTSGTGKPRRAKRPWHNKKKLGMIA
jgi:hypothetical protein